jgi:hypothetical protein
VLRESVFDVGLDPAGEPLVRSAPDDVLSLQVVTSPAYRATATADDWRTDVSAVELADLLELYGVDAWFNPGALSSTRLIAAEFRRGIAEAASLSADKNVTN